MIAKTRRARARGVDASVTLAGFRDDRDGALRLHLYHFKIILAHAAIRAFPVIGNVIPASARCNAILWPALRFVVDKSANNAFPAFH